MFFVLQIDYTIVNVPKKTFSFHFTHFILSFFFKSLQPSITIMDQVPEMNLVECDQEYNVHVNKTLPPPPPPPI